MYGFEYGYPIYWGCQNNNNYSWLWIIIVVFIIICLFKNCDSRNNCC